MVSSTDYHLILLPVELYAASVQITPGMCGNFSDKKNGVFITSNLFRETWWNLCLVSTQDAADVYGEVQEDEEDEENEGEEANIDATLHANVSLCAQPLRSLLSLC